jgi:hypothetical protein
MHRLSKHMLLPADRKTFDKWLVGMSIFYGSITLFIIGLFFASQVPDMRTKNQAILMTPCPIAKQHRGDHRPPENGCP